MTKIVFNKNFVKKLRKLDPKIRKALRDKSAIFKENKFDPILNNHSVEKRYPCCRSINITGDFRIIFQDFGNVAEFLKIGTHSELYK